MKKVLIYLIALILSLVFAIFTDNNITTNVELTIQILLTLLGLCITSYIFICGPISSVVSKNKNLKTSAINLINKLEEDMKTIFYIALIIIAVSIMKKLDFIFIKNPHEVDFELFIIKSFKDFVFNSVLSFCFILGLMGFYDYICASFKVTKNLLFINENN